MTSVTTLYSNNLDYPAPSAPPYDEQLLPCPQPPSEPYPLEDSAPPPYSENSAGLQGRKVSFFRKAAHFVKAGLWATASVVARLASLLLGVVATVFSIAAVLTAGTGIGIPLALASLGTAATAGVLAFLTKKIAKKCFKNV